MVETLRSEDKEMTLADALTKDLSFKCPICSGKGTLTVAAISDPSFMMTKNCYKCGGKGVQTLDNITLIEMVHTLRREYFGAPGGEGK